ncbi:unnamed protein product [Chrysoparadoxa australica]
MIALLITLLLVVGSTPTPSYGFSLRPAQPMAVGSGLMAFRRLAACQPCTPLMATPAPEVPGNSVTPPVTTPSAPPPSMVTFGESPQRSLTKALLWRLTAAVVTLCTGLFFSGDLAVAATIVGSDFVSKAGFMFLGERLWTRVQWGQGGKGDSTQRSLAKAVLWRVFAAANTLICSAFLAKDLGIAGKIAGADTVFKTALFFFNERVWSKVEWGKEYNPEYQI